MKNLVGFRIYLSFLYSLVWLVAVLKWIPDYIASITTDSIYQPVLNLGISGTLLIPLYLIFVYKIKIKK